ncbi:MAG: sulfatase-like hydrolase/transferase [Bacteroidetes bacterium]|nr:sulfatase-like hydrolase/transferase [Bacteroidota bacterium]
MPDSNRQLHAAMVTELDKGVKRVYKTLEKEGLLENTIIWFASDNGGECAEAYPESAKKKWPSLPKFLDPLFLLMQWNLSEIT